MQTAIVSDLHLGSASGGDLARDSEIRGILLSQLSGADRVVLLGDVVELFELPLPIALERARPFFEDLGEALTGRQVVLVPGNHDHRLAEPLLERSALERRPLRLEQRTRPLGQASEQIAGWLGGAQLEVAYPGIWLRDDVYATHGHYMDCHRRLPRLECVAAAATIRAFGPLGERAWPDDYERVLWPVYGLAFGLAQAGLARPITRPSERAWRAASSRGMGRKRVRRALLRSGVPAAVWGLNGLLRSDFDANLSLENISDSGIKAAIEFLRRLEIDAAHTITAHTHRRGPGPAEESWSLSGGGSLHNTGSWIFAPAFRHLSAPPDPFLPGTVTWLDENGPPRRVNDLPRSALRPAMIRLSEEVAARPPLLRRDSQLS